MFRRKKQLLFSLFVLVIGYFVLGTFFQFGTSSEEIEEADDLSIMTYNVRGFNRYEVINSPTVFEDIKQLIDDEKPSIICFQEFGSLKRNSFTQYKYKYVKYIRMQHKVIMGFYSKYPIVSEGLVNFPNSANNGAYIDVLYKRDTVRVYNLHMESLKIRPNRTALSNEESGKLYKRIAKSFEKQQEQAAIFRKHKEAVSYKIIVCSDLNNTQFSNVYKVVKGDMRDSFMEKGAGYGRTYNFRYFPLRIDFIFADPEFQIISHKNYDANLSDHFPVMTTLRLL
ncbi:MAG: endonuclease/exonuclease/phosphatase family protein [Cellulophaga sp.]